MAEIFNIPRTTSHVRSTSLPSTLIPHPTDSYIETLLRKLCNVEPLTSSSSICRTLYDIHDLYDNINSSIQSLVVNQNRNGVEDVLEGCLGLIDFVASTVNVLSSMKESIVEVRSCLRRKNGAEEKGINAYMMSRKTSRKMVDKCLKNLHHKRHYPKNNEGGVEIVPILDVLQKAEAICLDTMKSILIYSSKSKSGHNGKGWSLVDKLMHTNRVSCNDLVDGNEIKRIDVAISGLELKNSGTNNEKMTQLIKELENVLSFIQEIEGYLELISRCLLKTRVSLLNVISSC